MTDQLRIAIVGGGLGGLTLARILALGGVASTVFEREAHAGVRPQGGTLDLHADSGQLALRQAGLEKEFLAIARYEDQGSRLCDKTGRLLLADDEASAGDRPEVDRTALRKVLLASLPSQTVRWDHPITGVHSNVDGTYDVAFAHGGRETFDLVVGADGTWSTVRPLVSRYEPQYSGLTFIEFGIDDADSQHSELSSLVGRGKLGVEGNDGRALVIQRNGNAHLRGYAIFRVPADWARDHFDFSSPSIARTQLAAEFVGWSSSILELIRASNDLIVPRPIYALPVGHHWANRVGVTLLGDAAHVMSPFGGEGANAALLDAAELGRRLIDMGDWQSAVEDYEQDMFCRVAEAAKASAEGAATELSHVALSLSLETMMAQMRERPCP